MKPKAKKAVYEGRADVRLEFFQGAKGERSKAILTVTPDMTGGKFRWR